MAYCPERGLEVEESDNFCPSYGKELGKTIEKKITGNEVLKGFPSFHKVFAKGKEFPKFHKIFARGVIPGVLLMGGAIVVALYFILEKIINSLKVRFGAFEVGLVTPNITWLLIIGVLFIIIGIIALVWGYFYYKSEYEKLQRKIA